MIYVKGKVLWTKSRDVEFQKNGKKESFEEHTYLVCENGERPQEVKSTQKKTYKSGEDVAIPVFLKRWRGKDGSQGVDLIEVGRK